MSVQAIEQRIKEITAAIEQSLANHNALVGRLSEAQHILSVLTTVASDVAPVVQAVEDVAADL